MANSFFITGTDTGIGKTLVTTTLMNSVRMNSKINVVGYKPIASGAIYNPINDRIENSDALALLNHSNIKLNYHDVNPYCFEQATSPHIASQLNHHPIDQEILDYHLLNLQKKADLVLIEGAGGWFTPISSQFLFADWVIKHQLPIILVVGMKLGCISHALLTQQAIKQAKLKIQGWIANSCTEQDEYYRPYLETLTKRIDAPLLGEIPFIPNITSNEAIDYIKKFKLISAFNLEVQQYKKVT